jgi:hypothetical protein
MPAVLIEPEQALCILAKSLAAVTALTGSRIRPMKFSLKDDISAGPGLLIFPLQETNQIDLSGRGGAESFTMLLRCVAETMTKARQLASAVRDNNTNPGTGFEGYSGTPIGSGISIQMITLDSKTFDQIFYMDGSDEGYYVVDWHATVDFGEAL